MMVGKSITNLLVICGVLAGTMCGISRAQAADPDLVQSSPRSVFLRMEKDAELELTARGGEKLSGGLIQVYVNDKLYREYTIPVVSSGSDYRVSIPVNTGLKTGDYSVKAVLKVNGDTPTDLTRSFKYVIVPRRLPHRMPVIMWGGPLRREWADYGAQSERGRLMDEIERLKRLGFSHCFLLPSAKVVDYKSVFDSGSPQDAAPLPEAASIFDAALENDFRFCLQAYSGYMLRYDGEIQKRLVRVDRYGSHYSTKNVKEKDICWLFPATEKYNYDFGATIARTYGRFPAVDGVLINSEARDQTRPCFHEHDRAAFRKYSGVDIPAEVANKRGVPYKDIKDFDPLRVVDDNNPIYLYYKWFWKQGDGWNAVQSAVSQGVKSTGRANMWTWYDPAVRVPSVYGSGGMVDYISNWSYTTPEPLHPAMSTDNLLAMSKGSSRLDQGVMSMTQLIWRRHQSAPVKGESASSLAPWEADHDKATFITIAPMHLREAFWAMISRPVKGIMFHGWGSLVWAGDKGYTYTNPNTQQVLTKLTKEVVEPLGPTLMQVPGVKSDVAFLQSFASEMLAGRGTYGWGGNWGNDAYAVLEYAQLQPEIVFDETIVEKGLDGFKVLVLADCDVLTRKTVERIKAFQVAGGIVIGDENLAPAVKPDILLPHYARRPNRAKEAREALLSRAAALRRELDGRYSRYAESTNPNVITYRRRYGTTDYLFAINDSRECGTYVGQYGMGLEDGLPSKTELLVSGKKRYIYDLVS
ncbi:MAG: hypothetical protein PHT33_02440, partial [bacterium]|nr:hypothetical protein [bacterium]